MAQLKNDLIIFTAIADPYAHPEFFEEILSKLNKLSSSAKLNAKFESSAKEMMVWRYSYSYTVPPRTRYTRTCYA